MFRRHMFPEPSDCRADLEAGFLSFMLLFSVRAAKASGSMAEVGPVDADGAQDLRDTTADQLPVSSFEIVEWRGYISSPLPP
jgi:hypothetical protein